jgi:hypothetical protein
LSRSSEGASCLIPNLIRIYKENAIQALYFVQRTNAEDRSKFSKSGAGSQTAKKPLGA